MTAEQRAPEVNPFPDDDEDRRAIWEMLVTRDIDAFIAADWMAVDGDFDRPCFLGINAGRNANPDDWKLAFPSLEDYRDEWLRQANEFAAQSFAEDTRAAIFRATKLTDIEIRGDQALAHKKFDGIVRRSDGGTETLNWQTVYYCRKRDNRWLISGFTGYLPHR
ncbi:MAG: hypothetical protein AAF414_00420 [Pseudomonadota bacterium]